MPQPSYEPKDPRFRERVAESFGRQRAMHTLGITLTRLAAGEIEVAMPYAQAYTQQHGFVHAGIVTTALDSACGYAAFSLMPADSEVLTVEFKTNLLAPAKGERFVFRARVVKPGRTITVCDAAAFAIDAGTEKAHRHHDRDPDGAFTRPAIAAAMSMGESSRGEIA